jgi:CelD/BcsL family acetyltransferase involved in cellulose biosynthesis
MQVHPQVHWLTTPEEFIPWVDAWRDLLHRSPTPPSPYHAPAWILGCWRSPGTRVAVGLVAEGQRLRVGLVCNAETEGGRAMLVPACQLSFTPHILAALPTCLVAVADQEPPTELHELLDHSVRHFRWQVMFVNFLDPSAAWFETAVGNTAAARGWRLRQGSSSPDAFIDTTGGAAGYLAHRNRKHRETQRRARNQLLALGELSAVEVAATDLTNTALEAELIDSFERCWQRNSIHSPLHPTTRPHLLRLLEGMREAGLLRVYFLRLNGQAIAFEFGFVDRHAGGLYHACVRGYDDAWKKNSPGNLLLEFIIDETATAGLRGINFGSIHQAGDSLYKQTWLTAELPVRNLLVVRPRTAYGLLDRIYERSLLFRRIWWKLGLGKLLRRFI